MSSQEPDVSLGLARIRQGYLWAVIGLRFLLVDGTATSTYLRQWRLLVFE